MANIRLINRDTKRVTEVARNIRNSADIAPLLESWYRKYDVECCCTKERVVMHIRYRQDSELYYLADNPTSEKHDEKCELFTTRKLESQIEKVKLEPIIIFSPYRERSESELSLSKNSTSSNKPIMTTLEKVFSTLVTNSFSNYQFGSYVSLPVFVDKLIKAEKNKSIKTPWNKNLSDIIFYGPKGKGYAHSAVMKLKKSKDNLLPATLWFHYAPEGTTYTGNSVTIRDITFKAKRVAVPNKAGGPYIMLCTITADNVEENVVRDALLVPVVSKDYIFPVFSDSERATSLEFLPKLFGLNNTKSHSHFLVKPLWPVFMEGIGQNVPIWPSFILIRKSKSDGTKQIKVISDSNQSFLADVYGCEVISLKDLNEGVNW